MNKSILVIDAPKCCKECPCGTTEGTKVFNNCCYCKVLDRKIPKELYSTNIPKWCPLKEIPQKKDCIIFYGDGFWTKEKLLQDCFSNGYNTCIDEILKERD